MSGYKTSGDFSEPWLTSGRLRPYGVSYSIAMKTDDGGNGVVIDVEFQVFGPFFSFFEGLDGLAFTGGDDKPVGLWVLHAIENRFGGAGEVLAGLARPEADFEA